MHPDSPKTRDILDTLKKFESPDVTYIDDAGGWPIIWQEAHGCEITDVDGKKYLDLTGAFGVAVTGHANPAVVGAGQRQMQTLMHAMGDVHPHSLKSELCRKLSQLTFEKWTSTWPDPLHGRTTLCNSGFEAVETALKTAALATGKSGVISFEGGYHGLGYGALNVTHRSHFRQPFISQLREFGQFVPFPTRHDDATDCLNRIESILESGTVGAVLLEPAQARGGLRFPPHGFLSDLRELTRNYQTLLILDEIYTGFCRTGTWFACEHEGVVPDLICLGKGLTGGFPMAACTGAHTYMEAAWRPSRGEAVHTSTFLGHPVGCAMALAQIGELEGMDACRVVRDKGERLVELLRSGFGGVEGCSVRGMGLMCGVEIGGMALEVAGQRVFRAVREALSKGYVFLPCGEFGNIVSWTPPYVISDGELERSVDVIVGLLASG
jgi:4-aminobutyrate aminotransferase-like enzyme